VAVEGYSADLLHPEPSLENLATMGILFVMREVETIIVGGGISGLACADTLTRNGYRDFALVSPEVGGRVGTSNNGRVNYGAYYVRRDYHHLLPHVTRKRRLRA
jgi:monoamine oxidase